MLYFCALENWRVASLVYLMVISRQSGKFIRHGYCMQIANVERRALFRSRVLVRTHKCDWMMWALNASWMAVVWWCGDDHVSELWRSLGVQRGGKLPSGGTHSELAMGRCPSRVHGQSLLKQTQFSFQISKAEANLSTFLPCGWRDLQRTVLLSQFCPSVPPSDACIVTRLNDALRILWQYTKRQSCRIKISAVLCLVLSQSTRVTDRQT